MVSALSMLIIWSVANELSYSLIRATISAITKIFMNRTARSRIAWLLLRDVMTEELRLCSIWLSTSKPSSLCIAVCNQQANTGLLALPTSTNGSRNPDHPKKTPSVTGTSGGSRVDGMRMASPFPLATGERHLVAVFGNGMSLLRSTIFICLLLSSLIW